jgi:hypothetical protein
VPLPRFGCSTYTPFLLFLEFDLNLPLDEFGAIDMDFVQNIAGKIECFRCFYYFKHLVLLH